MGLSRDVCEARENRPMANYTEVTGYQPDLQKMTKGYPVHNLQELLYKHCFGPVVDSYFGDETERCLNAFKTANGLSADSIVDQATWAVLNGPPQWIARFYGLPTVSGFLLQWTTENIGCGTIPANSVTSKCWAYERANITNLSLDWDFGPTTDQPATTQESFAIDLFSLFPHDGQYTAVVQVGQDMQTLDYDIVNRQVVV
jgi:peptidoglycan hydrolase-like protein with peptidoglycan-binding domain